MSKGYVALTVLFFLLTLVVCLLVYWHYTSISFKRMPLFCSIWHVIALYICMLPFPLLVVDIDAALSSGSPSIDPQTWMQPIWIMIFTVTYLSGWVALPIAQAFTEVGDFEWKKALIHSIKLNLKTYAIILSVVAIVFVYVLILNSAYTSVAGVFKVAISLANAWGLLILILFLPAGLIGIPRMLWRYVDTGTRLQRILFQATDIQEVLDFAAMDLVSIKGELIVIDPLVADEHRPHLAHMLELISRAEQEIPPSCLAARRSRVSTTTQRNDISLSHLVDLHARLKSSIKKAERASYGWAVALRRCRYLDEAIRSVSEGDTKLKLWFYSRKYVILAGCIVTSFLTVVILCSELVLPFRMLSDKPLSLLELIMKSRVHFIGSVVVLFYMAHCTYWAAMQFKLFDVYVVHPSIADNASLCFNVTFLLRLLMPLCFNFLLITGLSGEESGIDVMYGHVYRRNMDVSLLFGEWCNRFLPILIPFIAMVVLFNFSQKILSLVGVEIHNPCDVRNPEVRRRIADGKTLIENELGYTLSAITVPEEVVPNGTDNGRTLSSDKCGTAGQASQNPTRGQRYREYLSKKRGTTVLEDDVDQLP